MRAGGQQKLITFSARKSTFRVRDNDSLQSLLDDLAEGCFTHYENIDQDLMEALYGIPDETSPPPCQSQTDPTPGTDLAPAEDSESDSSDDFMDIISAMRRVKPVPTLGEHAPVIPPLQQATQPPADPCDVPDGFLSVHASLVDLFRKWKRNAAPRQDDQFVLRFSQDPVDVALNVAPRGISGMSRSQTLDSKEPAKPRPETTVSAARSQNASTQLDTTTSSAPSARITRKKRRQSEEEPRANNAAPRVDSSGGPPSKTQVVKKRQKKTQ